MVETPNLGVSTALKQQKNLDILKYQGFCIFWAPQVRLELTTHGLTVRCSNQLSY